ncbi:MAG: DegT/DnrJ/EryC1/StrS family aminotransferase [Actinomycetota bacterium]|nr:DegT/DnrJ/EryC1/StrS family aminotransferase [Actinomycetota bacterium]
MRRKAALLGGTTTIGDCAVAARLLARPRQLVRGPGIEEYERAFAAHVGVRHAFSFASGRVGLFGLLQAMGIGSGDEVLLQVPTHIVVPNAIRFTGARPVFVDCRLDSYNMDLQAAERLVSPRTKALVLQHTFGIPADIDAALELGRRHGFEVIEDCVHALGATYRGRQVGSLGRAAFFSTEETKTITTIMGGMAVTDDPEIAASLRDFQSACAWPSVGVTVQYLLKFILYHFLTDPRLYPYSRTVYELTGRRQVAPGATSEEEKRGERPAEYEERLSSAQAQLAIRQLGRLQANVDHRARVASEYAARFSALGFRPPAPSEQARSAMVRYPLWVEDRARAVEAAADHMVLGTWFTSVLEEALTPAHGGYESGSCPRAEAAARHLVNLPTHGRVTDRDIEAITEAIAGLRPPQRPPS